MVGRKEKPIGRISLDPLTECLHHRLFPTRDPIAGAQVTGGRFTFSAANGNSAERRVTICSGLKSFVTTRGGEYFFLPGLGGVRYLGEGSYHI